MPKSRPGRLKHRVEIYGVTTTTDALAGSTVTKTLKSTEWAEVVRVTGRRAQDLQAVGFKRPYEVTFRANVDVEENDELVFIGATLVVSSVEPDLDLSKYQTVLATSNFRG